MRHSHSHLSLFPYCEQLDKIASMTDLCSAFGTLTLLFMYEEQSIDYYTTGSTPDYSKCISLKYILQDAALVLIEYST